MAQLSRLTSDLRANFVAYLDGEVDEATAEQIDRTVAENEVARREIERFAQVYDLLEELPDAKPSGDFTQTTVQAIRQEALDEGTAGRLQNVTYRLRPLLLVAGFASVVSYLGTMAGALLLRENDTRRLELLPVARAMPTLEAVREVAFIEELRGRTDLVNRLRQSSLSQSPKRTDQR